MVMIEKRMIDVNTVLVKMTFIMKGNREKIEVNTTLAESCDFVDALNENKHKRLTKAEKEAMENRFYIFNDYIKKETICINFYQIKAFTVPFLIDEGKEYNFKIMEWRAK